MTSLELPTRNLATVVIEASIGLAMNIRSIVGNFLVCLAVYKNPKLRSTTNFVNHRLSNQLSVVRSSVNADSFRRVNRRKMDFRRPRMSA